jgi:2-polyprenyl-6-methoxyphenol hydroxylase-like FAD-dependent oxidoreductase
VGIDRLENQVIAHFADGTRAAADLLVGADGVNSVVRGIAFPCAPRPAFTGLVGIGGFVPIAAVPQLAHSNVMTFTYGRRGFFGYSRLDTGHAMWWSNLFREREFSAAEIRAHNWPALRDELLNRFRDYGVLARALLENTASALRMNVHDIQSLPTWHHERVILIGDAAHTVSPNVGQGASLALEDAQYLAKVLGESSGHAHAFARFERDRKPRAERVVAEGRRRGADKAIVGPIRQKLRELFLGAVLRRYGATADRWMFEYKIN